MIEVVLRAQRPGSANLKTITLSGKYLKNAGRVAQSRALLAAKRLAAVWAECFVAAA